MPSPRAPGAGESGGRRRGRGHATAKRGRRLRGQGRADTLGARRRGRAHGEEGAPGAAASDEATGRPRVASPSRRKIRAREGPWGMSSWTWLRGGAAAGAETATADEVAGRPQEEAGLVAVNRGDGCRRCRVWTSLLGGEEPGLCRGRGHNTAAKVVSSVDVAARDGGEECRRERGHAQTASGDVGCGGCCGGEGQRVPPLQTRTRDGPRKLGPERAKSFWTIMSQFALFWLASQRRRMLPQYFSWTKMFESLYAHFDLILFVGSL